VKNCTGREDPVRKVPVAKARAVEIILEIVLK
jgi:hypothetical protein